MRWTAKINGQPVDDTVTVDFTIRTGRDSCDEQPTAGTAALQLASRTDPMHWIQAGQPVVISGEPPDAVHDPTPPAVFTGTVSDVERRVELLNGQRKYLIRLTAAGPASRPGRVYTGDEPWPVELDGIRVGRVLIAAGSPPVLRDPSQQLIPDARMENAPDTGGTWTTATTKTGTRIDHTPGTLTFTSGIETRHWADLDPRETWDRAAGTWDDTAAHNVLSTRQPFPARGWLTIAASLTVAEPATLIAVVTSAARAADARIGATQAVTQQAACYVSDSATAEFLFDIPDGHRAATLTLISPVDMSVTWVGAYPGSCDPGTANLVALDVDRRTCAELFASCANSTGGLVAETRHGRLAYIDAARRVAGVAPDIRIPASAIERTATRRETAAARINRLTVAYSRAEPGGGEQPELTVEHAWSIREWGTYEQRMTTDLDSHPDALNRAVFRLNNRDRISTEWDQLPVHLAELSESTAWALLTLRPGALIEITGLDSGAYQRSSWLGYVEGFTLTTSPWPVMTLHVSDVRHTTPLATWDDPAPDLTWRTIAPGLIWHDVLEPPARKASA